MMMRRNRDFECFSLHYTWWMEYPWLLMNGRVGGRISSRITYFSKYDEREHLSRDNAVWMSMGKQCVSERDVAVLRSSVFHSWENVTPLSMCTKCDKHDSVLASWSGWMRWWQMWQGNRIFSAGWAIYLVHTRIWKRMLCREWYLGHDKNWTLMRYYRILRSSVI